MPPPPFPTTDAHTPVHADTQRHSRAQWLARALARVRAAAREPCGRKARLQLGAGGPEAGRPGTSCWAVVLGRLAPQRGPGEAAASVREPVNPLGKEVLAAGPPDG